jgi:hypothetical protein
MVYSKITLLPCREFAARKPDAAFEIWRTPVARTGGTGDPSIVIIISDSPKTLCAPANRNARFSRQSCSGDTPAANQGGYAIGRQCPTAGPHLFGPFAPLMMITRSPGRQLTGCAWGITRFDLSGRRMVVS